MVSILYKLNSLQLITPKRNKSLNVHISRGEYRKSEPSMGVTIDEPTLLNQLIEAHLNEFEYTKKILLQFCI